jgi:hypothetical protein
VLLSAGGKPTNAFALTREIGLNGSANPGKARLDVDQSRRLLLLDDADLDKSKLRILYEISGRVWGEEGTFQILSLFRI